MAYVPKYVPTMKRTNYYFPPQTTEKLRKAKELTGLPMSEIVRRALDAYLKGLGL